MSKYVMAISFLLVTLFLSFVHSTELPSPNKALYLNGSDNSMDIVFDKMEVPSDNFTLSAWVKPEGVIRLPKMGEGSIITPSMQKYLLYPAHGNTWSSVEGPAGVGLSVGTNGIVVYENAFWYFPAKISYKDSLSEWKQITLVYKDKQPSLYINGFFVSRGLVSDRNSVKLFPVHFGGEKDEGDKYTGLIDEFAIWDRTLTSDEIARNYYEKIDNTDDGLILYYNFNRMNGDGTINDNSKNSHTGVLIGGATLQNVHQLYKQNVAVDDIVYDDLIEYTPIISDIDSIPVIAKTERPDGIAIIIGIEKYKNAPPSTFAKKDALIFEKYANKLLGIPSENIYTITNEAATLGEFMKLFGKNGYLKRRTNEKTEIFIYYSGHGAPDLETKMPYLIPSDVDPNYPTTGYSTKKLYENLGLLNAKSITIFLDACFSGATRSNEMLLADARPVRIEWVKSAIPENLTVMTASSGAQISSGYPKEGHGLFSYYLMKGLQKFSDKDLDSKITIEELYNYIKVNVSKTAGQLDREQTPELFTNKNKQVLVEY